MTGDCPGGSTCSPKTPDGLDFSGEVPVLPSFPPDADLGHNHLATGGADEIQLRADDVPFDLPFTAQVDDATAISVDSTTTSTVTLRGHGGQTELNIVDPATGLLFDRYAYASSALASVRAVPAPWSGEVVGDDARAFAFAPGDLAIGVAMLDGQSSAHRLIDIDATLTAQGATQIGWDLLSLPGAALGHHALGVASGGATAATEIDVVDHADDLVQLQTSYADQACFGAEATGAATPEQIIGLSWTFTVNGAARPSSFFGTNCVDLPLGASSTVVASAGGKSLTVQVSTP